MRYFYFETNINTDKNDMRESHKLSITKTNTYLKFKSCKICCLLFRHNQKSQLYMYCKFMIYRNGITKNLTT